jgi:putative heme-binding domain-containing protein
MNLGKMKSQELVGLLTHPNVWQRRMAQRLLSERSEGPPGRLDEDGKSILGGNRGLSTSLEQLALEPGTLESRLAALWTLHAMGTTWTNSFLQRLIEDKEPAMRAWTARFLGERLSEGNLPDESLAYLEKLAADSDASVRLAVAAAVRGIVSGSLTVDKDIRTDVPTGRILSALIKSCADGKDLLLSFMIWMAGEPVFAAHPEGGLSWLADNGPATMPLSGILTRKAMRRICDTQEASRLDLAVDFLGRLAQKNAALTLAAIDGLIEGQRAKPVLPSADTKPLFETLNATGNPQIQERAHQLGTLWGNAASIQAMLRAINDPNLPVEQRMKAVATVKRLKNDAARGALLELITHKSPEPVMVEALRALGEIGGDAVSDNFLGSWKAFPPPARAVAAEVLVSRRSWALALLSAIEAKTISAMELPMAAVRSLGESKDEFIRQRALQVIGRIRPANADKQKIIEEKKKMILVGGAPDLAAGREIAKKSCLICHKFYGEGAEVGPDLTGAGRSSLDALLANVIDPNQVIGKGYENVEVETRDGRSVSGRLVENTNTRVKLLSPGPKEEVIAKSDIATLRVSELSVMPEGLEQMPDADFRNLILYVLNPPAEKDANNR